MEKRLRAAGYADARESDKKTVESCLNHIRVYLRFIRGYFSFLNKLAMIAFCRCSRFSASSITTDAGESMTPSVTITLRRTANSA